MLRSLAPVLWASTLHTECLASSSTFTTNSASCCCADQDSTPGSEHLAAAWPSHCHGGHLGSERHGWLYTLFLCHFVFQILFSQRGIQVTIRFMSSLTNMSFKTFIWTNSPSFYSEQLLDKIKTKMTVVSISSPRKAENQKRKELSQAHSLVMYKK